MNVEVNDILGDILEIIGLQHKLFMSMAARRSCSRLDARGVVFYRLRYMRAEFTAIRHRQLVRRGVEHHLWKAWMAANNQPFNVNS